MTPLPTRRRCFACVAALCAFAGAAFAADPDPRDAGTWTAELRLGDGAGATVQLELRPLKGDSRYGHSVDLRELPGFDPKDGEAHFSLVREAGVMRFDGTFHGGAGAGHYLFERSKTFAGEMAQLGFPDAGSEDQLFLAFMDLGPRRARELRALGLTSLSWDNLRAFAIHGVTPREIEELRALGLSARDPDSLIAFRIHGVSPEFIRGLRKEGLAANNEESLIAFRIHGVSPEFVRDIRKAGLHASSEERLVALRIHGVTPEFLEELRGLGVMPTDEQAIALRIHGVTPGYVRKLRKAGYSKAGPDDFVRLRIGGFTPPGSARESDE